MTGLPKYHLTCDKDRNDWELKREGAKRATRRFATKGEAMGHRVLEKLLGSKGGSVRIHRMDGTFEEERTFPAAPPKRTARR